MAPKTSRHRPWSPASARKPARAAAPSALWQPSRRTGQPPASKRSRRPGQRTAATPAAIVSAVLGRAGSGRSSAARTARAAFHAWWAPGRGVVRLNFRRGVVRSKRVPSIATLRTRTESSAPASCHADPRRRGLGAQDLQRVSRRPDDRGPSGTEDARLFPRDQGERRAELLGVVEPDGRDRGEYRRRHIRRVETAAQAHLQDCQVEPALAEDETTPPRSPPRNRSAATLGASSAAANTRASARSSS